MFNGRLIRASALLRGYALSLMLFEFTVCIEMSPARLASKAIRAGRLSCRHD